MQSFCLCFVYAFSFCCVSRWGRQQLPILLCKCLFHLVDLRMIPCLGRNGLLSHQTSTWKKLRSAPLLDQLLRRKLTLKLITRMLRLGKPNCWLKRSRRRKILLDHNIKMGKIWVVTLVGLMENHLYCKDLHESITHKNKMKGKKDNEWELLNRKEVLRLVNDNFIHTIKMKSARNR